MGDVSCCCCIDKGTGTPTADTAGGGSCGDDDTGVCNGCEVGGGGGGYNFPP